MSYLPGSAVPPARHPPAPPARLVEQDRLDPVRDGAAIATIYAPAGGGAIRRLVGGAHRHGIAVRRDPQMPFAQPTEGVVEGPAALRCATDPDVGPYQTQPFRIVAPVAGRLASWTADIMYVDRGGVVWVREIKRSASDLLEPVYVAKLETMSWLLGRLGWHFRPWLRPEIEGPPGRRVNTATIYVDRGASLDGLLPRFEAVARAADRMTLGELVHALDANNRCRARAAVHRLIMRGRVWADLDVQLEEWSPVRLRPPSLHRRLPIR